MNQPEFSNKENSGWFIFAVVLKFLLTIFNVNIACFEHNEIHILYTILQVF
jgi:hypothetical protein